MKPDYKNWMPKGMILSFLAGAAAALALCFACEGLLKAGTLKSVLVVAFAALAVAFFGLTIWSVMMYRAFDYNGNRKLSKQVIDGVATRVQLPEGGWCLDIKTPTLIQYNNSSVAYRQAG